MSISDTLFDSHVLPIIMIQRMLYVNSTMNFDEVEDGGNNKGAEFQSLN